MSVNELCYFFTQYTGNGKYVAYMEKPEGVFIYAMHHFTYRPDVRRYLCIAVFFTASYSSDLRCVKTDKKSYLCNTRVWR